MASIIKDTIMLDKKAREQIKELELEKSQLDDRVKEEAKLIREAFENANKKKLKARKAAFEQEIKTREKNELEHFNRNLKAMKEQFENHKDEWIEEIYIACTKA